MKRILCLIDSLGPGGAQRQLVGLARFLKERGYDVIVATYHDNRFYVDQLLSAGVPYVYVKKAQRGFFRQWYLMRYIRRARPDVVIAYLESPSVRACVSHVFNRRFQLIVSERNTTQHTGRAEKLRFALFRLADYIVPNAFAQAEYIKNTFPNLSEKVITIPNFVDLQHFVPAAEHSRRTVPEIIVVATIWASKNTLGFIDAVALLKKRGVHFHVSWYGKGESSMDYFNKCQEKIKYLGISDFIELKEKTTKIRDKYQEADYFCLPSFYEGTPNVICEAMACGLPVACSNVCDNSRYVKERENGFLFDPHNAESIATALENILALCDDKYRNFCMRSREMAEMLLSEETFVQSYINLISKKQEMESTPPSNKHLKLKLFPVNLINKIKFNRFVRGFYCLYKSYFGNCNRSKFGFIAEDVTLIPPLQISNPGNVFLYGNNGLNNASIMTTNAKFIMKPNSGAAEGLRVTTGNHAMIIGRFYRTITEAEKPKGLDKDVIVESDVWIGRNVTLLSGVTLGRGAVIGAGAVVSRDIPPYTVAVGVPARPVRMKWTVEQILEHEAKLYPENERFTREELEDIFAKYDRKK